MGRGGINEGMRGDGDLGVLHMGWLMVVFYNF